MCVWMGLQIAQEWCDNERKSLEGQIVYIRYSNYMSNAFCGDLSNTDAL